MWGEHNLDMLKDRIFSMEAEIKAKTMALDEKKKAFDKELAEMKTQHKKVLTELSDAKAALEQEHEELKMLASDATRAMESAQVELGRVRAMAAADRDKRAKELRERQMMAAGRRHQADVSLARERARRDLLAEVAGDLGVSEERALINSVETAKQRKATLTDHSALIKRKLDAYEAAWRRIKDATGVSEIAEVTAKMSAQVRTLLADVRVRPPDAEQRGEGRDDDALNRFLSVSSPPYSTPILLPPSPRRSTSTAS